MKVNMQQAKKLEDKPSSQRKMSIQQAQKVSSKQLKFQKALKLMNITISPQQYASLHIQYLGNHSLWKQTTFQTRYNDQRLHLISPDYFLNKYVLDIGCNEGFLDIEIGMRCFPKQVYGIDIDSKLIKNARRTLYNIVKKDKNYHDLVNLSQDGISIEQKKYQHQQSLQQKQSICKKIHNLPLFFQDRLKESYSLDYYLPSNVKIFSQQMLKPQSKFPLNVKFQTDNIYTIRYQQDKLQYDTILCLKVTKWIHLTFGDIGIRRLFMKIYDLLKLDGILILQVQDWSSYKRKKNMNELYRRNYNQIQFGPNEFQTVLVNDPMKEFKFQLVEKIEQNQRKHKNDKKLDYPILVLKKKSTMLYY